MTVPLAWPAATPQQLEAHLRASFPRYTVTMRGGMPLVGDGLATGVLVKPGGPGAANLVWAFPNMGVQILLTLVILAGLLPGLLLFLIVWLSVKGGVDRLKQEVAAVLAGGQPSQAPLPAVGGAGPADPKSFALIFGVCSVVLGLMSLVMFLGFPGAGAAGVIGAVSWILVAVGAFMVQADDKRAFQSRAPRAGTARIVLGVAAVLHALLGLRTDFDAPALYVARGVFDSLFWLAAGITLIVAGASKDPWPVKRSATLLTVAGVVLLLLGLSMAYDVFFYFDVGLGFSLAAIVLILRVVLWLALGAVTLARAGAEKTGSDVIAAAAAPPPGYAAAPGYPPAPPYGQPQRYAQPQAYAQPQPQPYAQPQPQAYAQPQPYAQPQVYPQTQTYPQPGQPPYGAPPGGTPYKP